MLTALSQETKKITEHLKKESPRIPTIAGGPHPLEWSPWRNGRGNPQDFLLHNQKINTNSKGFGGFHPLPGSFVKYHAFDLN